MGEKLDKILEGYKPLSMGKLRYPRLKLSEDFINAFHREIDRLHEEGQNPKSLLERVSKALQFHVNEDRRYHQLDEDEEKDAEKQKEAFNQGQHGNYVEVATKKGIVNGNTYWSCRVEDIEEDPHEGDRGEKKAEGRSS